MTGLRCRNGVRPISGCEGRKLLLLIFCAEPLTQKAWGAHGQRDMRLPGPAGGQHGEEKDAGFPLSSGQLELSPGFSTACSIPSPLGPVVRQLSPCSEMWHCVLPSFCFTADLFSDQVMAQQGCCGDFLSRPTE